MVFLWVNYTTLNISCQVRSLVQQWAHYFLVKISHGILIDMQYRDKLQPNVFFEAHRFRRGEKRVGLTQPPQSSAVRPIRKGRLNKENLFCFAGRCRNRRPVFFTLNTASRAFAENP